MERLGKNIGKYLGEGIDIQQVIANLEQAAEQHGWQSEVFLTTDSCKLLALTRQSSIATKRLYISAGIHGDEPAGPLALLQMLQENRWPANADLWLCPCLNPTGFANNSRENAQGFDLNRQYLSLAAEETRAHIAWLDRQPNFDIAMCLHEDWEASGFYVYELNPDNQRSLAPDIIQRVSEICPIDLSSEIEGRPASGGLIRPSADPRSRPDWPEAFYLFTKKTRLSYTTEAPSDFPMGMRVKATVAAVRVVVDSF